MGQLPKDRTGLLLLWWSHLFSLLMHFHCSHILYFLLLFQPQPSFMSPCFQSILDGLCQEYIKSAAVTLTPCSVQLQPPGPGWCFTAATHHQPRGACASSQLCTHRHLSAAPFTSGIISQIRQKPVQRRKMDTVPLMWLGPPNTPKPESMPAKVSYLGE